MTLIPSLPKLTIFVIFGVLERNIPVKQTGEVQQLCVQSCVRVLKNTKDMEINNYSTDSSDVTYKGHSKSVLSRVTRRMALSGLSSGDLFYL